MSFEGKRKPKPQTQNPFSRENMPCPFVKGWGGTWNLLLFPYSTGLILVRAVSSCQWKWEGLNQTRFKCAPNSAPCS